MKIARMLAVAAFAWLAMGTRQVEARDLAGENSAIDPAHFRGDLAARAIFEESNRQRVAAGLAPLAPLAAAQTAGTWQAQAMAQSGEVSHVDSRDPNHRTLEDRIRAVGIVYRFIAENVAMNFAVEYEPRRPFFTRRGPNGETIFSYAGNGPPLAYRTYAALARAVVTQWLNSPGHRRNLLAREPQYLGCAAAFGLRDHSQGLGNVYCSQVFVALR
jgi:uncharacterized protein YkwD